MKPKKITIKLSEKLALRRETILVLTPRKLAQVVGGYEEPETPSYGVRVD